MVSLDTFMVAVYTLVDDVYQRHIAPHKPVRRGHRPELADSEVLTLMLLGQWLGNSERALLRHAATAWRCDFPRLLSQSAFNRRGRDLGAACAHLMRLIADELGTPAVPIRSSTRPRSPWPGSVAARPTAASPRMRRSGGGAATSISTTAAPCSWRWRRMDP